jgi:hypothetical protein
VRSSSSASHRDAVNELYDRGCDLVEAAVAIREAAGDAGGARAIPAVLGCVEAALDALSQATVGLQASMGAALDGTPGRRAERGLVHLETALSDAHVAAAAARALAARSLARSGSSG